MLVMNKQIGNLTSEINYLKITKQDLPKNKNICPYTDLPRDVHSSITHSAPKVKTTPKIIH